MSQQRVRNGLAMVGNEWAMGGRYVAMGGQWVGNKLQFALSGNQQEVGNMWCG